MDESVWKGRSVLIVGCGYLGSALARRARAAGAARVAALVRSDASAARLRASGVEAWPTDATSPSGWSGLAGSWDCIVGTISPRGAAEDAYVKTYVGAASSIASFAAQHPVGTLLWASSTGVYPPRAAEEIDENVPADDTPRARALVEAERCILAGRARAVVLRFAGLYGPGRHHFLDRIRAGLPLPGHPEGRLNLVHVDDACSALSCAFGSNASGIFNVADGRPPTRGELAGWLAARLERPMPAFSGGPVRADRIVCALRAREVLGWVPQHRDYRVGYEEILRGFAP